VSEGGTITDVPREREPERVQPDILELRQKEFRPATTRQKVLVGAIVIVVSAVSLFVWFTMFLATQSQLRAEYRVPWTPPPGIEIAPGPSSFFRDTRSNELVVRGAIDDTLKEQLQKLISKSGKLISPPDSSGSSYWQALDRLAFESNRSANRFQLYLLILGGLSGLMGVQLRSAINFVGVACFRNELDVVRWWPWYALRPAAGFVFGLTVVLLIQVGLFQAEAPFTGGTNWSLVVAILAGFGATEFAERLRQLAKTLFGDAPAETGSPRSTRR
jgi:hypothetical protein